MAPRLPAYSRPTVTTPYLRRWLFVPLAGLITLGPGLAGYYLSETFGVSAQADAGARQLELHARAVESELDKYTYLPSLLELAQGVDTLLAAPVKVDAREVNLYLEGLQARSGSRAIFIMTPGGQVVASSNWHAPDSFLGENLAFRPYFQDAIEGRPGRYYGVGSTTGEAGYFIAHGLRRDGRIIGVAVVKVRLDALEARWQKARLETFVSDENGIIILSSDDSRRFKSIWPLDDDSRNRLRRSLQYFAAPLTELSPLARERLSDSVERLTLTRDPAEGHSPEARYLAQSMPINDARWRMTLLTPLKDQRREAIVQGVLAAVAFALLAIGLIAWNERRKVIAARLAAREALQAANDLLERRIAERTADLRDSNDRLKGQIRERRNAEQTLRKAQDELVRAGKLAAIGQMSTSIAHELNQPLAALRTLSGNTVRFLERGHLDTASTNLRTINDLVERMGRIIASLRAFARGGEQTGSADVSKAVEAALGVLQQRTLARPVRLEQKLAPAVVAIEQTRLEQILINLLSNALDAVQNVSEPQVHVTGAFEQDLYRLRVQDNGQGIDAVSRSQLFEPFFTTKPGEQGLGLGLTLSAQLAAAAGGQLSLDANAEQGATFILTLPLCALSARSNLP
jgi:two-component system sensor histidine kinase AauS